MAESQTFPSTGELNNDPDIYHILSSSTAGANGHGYKQVWLTSGGNNPSYPYAGGDNPVPENDWDSFWLNLLPAKFHPTEKVGRNLRPKLSVGKIMCGKKFGQKIAQTIFH